MASESPITLPPNPGKESKPSLLSRIMTVQWLSTAGAVVALVTSVRSCQLQQTELKAKLLELQARQDEITRLKQQQAADSRERIEKAHKEYLTTLNGSDAVAQARILRFIIATETDEKLCAWAKQELQSVQATLDAQTRANQQRVADLNKNIETGKNPEEAKLEIAVRSSEMARLSLAKSETSSLALSVSPPSEPRVAPATPPAPAPALTSVSKPPAVGSSIVGRLTASKPAGNTTAECVGFCAQPARRCEASCAGDRSCIVGKCYPQEAQCRNDCQAGKLSL